MAKGNKHLAWGAVAAVGLAYAINEELRYRRERRRHLADRTRLAIGVNRIRGQAVAVPPGHASMVRDPKPGPAYWVGTMTGDDGLWHVYARDVGELDKGYLHRKSALRACRQMRAAAEFAAVNNRLA